MAIDLSRFRIPRQEYLVFSEATVDRWFLTPMATKIARDEILLRRKNEP